MIAVVIDERTLAREARGNLINLPRALGTQLLHKREVLDKEKEGVLSRWSCPSVSGNILLQLGTLGG